HSPGIAACMTQLFPGPAPRQDDPLEQSALVLHGPWLVEHVFGATGVAGWSALLMTRSLTVTRTWVSGVGSFTHPASNVPAYPVGRTPWTRFVILTLTCRCSRSPWRRTTRMRAAAPAGPCWGTMRRLSLPPTAGRDRKSVG